MKEHDDQQRLYTVSQKKADTILLSISLLDNQATAMGDACIHLTWSVAYE